MSLIGLRHKTQWEKANHKVGPFWVPNTFLRSYFNSETISLIVRLMVLSQDDAIYMVPRPLQKLGGNSPCCVHSGDSTRDCEFNSYVSYVLTLIKANSILVCTHTFTWFIPLPQLVMNGKMEGSIPAQVCWSSSHQLTIGAIANDGLWVC